MKGAKRLKILVTGAAGFIGAALSLRLLKEGHQVTGIDNFSPYYDVNLKKARLKNIRETCPDFQFQELDICQREELERLFEELAPSYVVNLAAQVGVRYSLENPYAYINTNIVGFLNILENAKRFKIDHLIYASSSSVYGANTKMPFSEHDSANHPVSLYGATKRADELMAHSYSSLFGLPTTGLRFFTVYGPWGRPDMALFKFAKNILKGEPIEVFQFGKHLRDFTYIDDIVEGLVRVIAQPPLPMKEWDSQNPDPATSSAPFKVFNIGHSEPVELSHCIEVLESCLGKKAEKLMLPAQAGDVPSTFADVSELEKTFGYRPRVGIEEGIKNFVAWYRDSYRK